MRNLKPTNPALSPGDLPRLIVERLNAADADGIAELYESDAILIGSDGQSIQGKAEIRSFYQKLLRDRPQFRPGVERCSIQNGSIALT